MSRIIPISPDQFGATLDQLFEMVVLGKAHSLIGRELNQSLAADSCVADVARVFWGMTITAHLEVAQMTAFKLFDTQSGTVTVRYLLDHAENLKKRFKHATPQQVEERVEECRQLVESLAESFAKLENKRNQFLAHLSQRFILDRAALAKAVQLSASDLDLIFVTAGKILSKISVA